MSKNPSGDPVLAAARDLKAQMQEGVVLPGDAAYEEARKVWNGAVDHRPAMIAFCRSVQNVQAAVRAARTHGLPLSVRGCGHDAFGRSVGTGALVIDISAMAQVEVDAADRVATVGGGTTAGAVAAAADAHGLLAVTGWHGVPGMAGLALGGGYGPLIASHGLALDNLVGAELVLADGRVVTADATHNPDLFWALRGGGGNFGVVTSLRLRLHPKCPMLGGAILFPWTDAERVLGGSAGIVASAGDSLTMLTGIFPLPDGSPGIMLAPAWTGEPDPGRTVMARLQQLGSPIHAQIGPMTYPDLLRSFDSQVVGGRHVALQSRCLPELTPRAISALIEAGGHRSSSMSAIVLQQFRGAAARIPADATAFGLRRDHVLVEIIAAWDAGAKDGGLHRQWARTLSDVLAVGALPGGYPNTLGPDDHDRIAHAYGGNAARLLQVKRSFDPDGVFSATPLPA
ncbi:FAD-binding oxidoreductase [Inquilinus sp.]|jgi:FAD/FMN-containing dehydrogenase|uniref:FAD-binding oxidoreductase n=1 Tax=Inquilinus sp. TaxID=1932117 RepID=UPI0037833094